MVAVVYIQGLIRLEKSTLIHGLKNGCCVNRHENNINFVVHFHQNSKVIRCLVNEH